MIDRIRRMNESQVSSLAARRHPAHRAVSGGPVPSQRRAHRAASLRGLGLVIGACAALCACGQKGPLFLPTPDTTVTAPAAQAPNASNPASAASAAR